jgi:hypothetical protein
MEILFKASKNFDIRKEEVSGELSDVSCQQFSQSATNISQLTSHNYVLFIWGCKRDRLLPPGGGPGTVVPASRNTTIGFSDNFVYGTQRFLIIFRAKALDHDCIAASSNGIYIKFNNNGPVFFLRFRRVNSMNSCCNYAGAAAVNGSILTKSFL